jgi:hypothetical protein
MDTVTGTILPLYFFNPAAGDLTPLHLTIRLNGVVQYDQAVIHSETFNYALPDEEQEHVIEFELSGKTDQHSVLNDRGEMDRNSCVSIRNLCFNDVPVNDMLYKIGIYRHRVTEPFYGALNYNGLAQIQFTTPVDLWLFENK